MNTKTVNKIMEYVAAREGCVSVAMLAADLFPRLRVTTVRARIDTLVSEGRLALRPPWAEGYSSTLELTDAERKDRAMDARIKKDFPALNKVK